MNILSERTANLKYAKISEIHNNANKTLRERGKDFRSMMETIFNEITANDVVYNATLFDRMKFIFDTKSIPREIVDGSHTARGICNKCSHVKPGEPI